MRTAMIYLLGMEYLGLNSLFTSVLSVLNLAELGVGAAMTFSMYKPIAEGDSAKICALMRLYKIYYRIIGAVILGLGLCIMPALPMLVKKDLPPDVNLYVLYVINLLATVFTYWLFAYKNCLLYAHQRNDVTDKIGYIVNTAKYGIQLLVLFIIKDYYIYIIVMLLGNIASNIVTALVVDRMYPQYKAMGKMPQSEVSMINRRIRDLFTSKVGLVVVDSADTIVISAFLGLTALAKYQNYYFILSTIYGFITLITSSSLAGIGNSIVTESSESSFMCLHKDKSLRLNGYRYAFFSLRLPAPYSESAKVYGSLQGWAQRPLLPLLLPITELIRHIPEWHTQSAPCTNISVSTPSETTFFIIEILMTKTQ